MKKTISIIGSTGSIGESSLKIIDSKKNFFNVYLLSANKNKKKIIEQINKYKPKYFVINDYKIYTEIKKKFKKRNTKIFHNYEFLKTDKKKIDISISAIPSLNGLEPTIKIIKKSKKLLLANKESVICGWNLIKKLKKKYNTNIIPIDSEHYSIFKLIENENIDQIEKIYLTASGGPFFNKDPKYLKNINPAQAIKHPKWKMGKKISVDSSTMMNKLLEVIEAYKIFDLPLNKFDIIIHPESLVHAIVKFKNGLYKFLYHEPNMIIPISNAIFDSNFKINDIKNIKCSFDDKKFSLEKLNFFSVNKKRFPVIKIFKKLDEYISTPIIINGANEMLVDLFLKKKLRYNGISGCLLKILTNKDYKKYAIKNPAKLKNIYEIDTWAKKEAFKASKKYQI